MLTNFYKPRAYILDFTVCPKFCRRDFLPRNRGNPKSGTRCKSSADFVHILCAFAWQDDALSSCKVVQKPCKGCANLEKVGTKNAGSCQSRTKYFGTNFARPFQSRANSIHILRAFAWQDVSSCQVCAKVVQVHANVMQMLCRLRAKLVLKFVQSSCKLCRHKEGTIMSKLCRVCRYEECTTMPKLYKLRAYSTCLCLEQ